MDETILFPSPNWFQPSGLAVSSDEWLVYGGPSKCLCVLEPLPADYEPVVQGQQGYTAHVVNRAHPEKIVCVDICPEWPEKRAVLTGSTDGAVKQWSLERVNRSLKIKSTHSHEIHSNDKEEVAGVGYFKDGYAVTVGSFGNIVKWDLNSNVAKSFNHVLKNFKPTCLACSPHIHMNVAIGTKQGVVIMLDLNGAPRVVYRVRAQDEEIVKVSWCPQYEVAVRKSLKESDKRSSAADRIHKIQKQLETPEVMKVLDERVKNSHTTDQPTLINEKSEPIAVGSSAQEVLDESGIGKTLPEDSFDESVMVQEDDMFDIYKDHEADEFGHKKFQPVDILVKVPQEASKEDYLTECQRLKEEILKRKAQSDSTIESLVEAMEKTGVEDKKPPEEASTSKPEGSMEGKIIKGEVESSVHIHKHLLATVGKQGSIRVWSKAGKIVGSCVVSGGGNKQGRRPAAVCSTLLWVRPDMLLIADGKSQLLDCNPLKIDCKNKLDFRVLHSHHKRGLFAIVTNAARVQTPEMWCGRPRDWSVWTAGQDRLLLRYSLAEGKLQTYTTCGGFLYTLRTCPYDARKVCVCVGDGTVRVWEAEGEDELPRLMRGQVTAYWQHVQGKVLTAAWHPTREGLLAFATAETRVGLIATGGKTERAAKLLQPSISGAVYSLSWATEGLLYMCSEGELMLFDVDHTDQDPIPVPVEFEGQKWEVSAVWWSPRAMLVGSCAGAVAVLTPHVPHHVTAACFVFSKMIHTLDWHPQQTSYSTEDSPYQDLIAVCSLDKANTVVILEYKEKEDGTRQLSVWKTLSGHKGAVLQLAWSPHYDEELLSTSADGTVRVWNIASGSCTAIFGGHAQSTMGAAWSPHPHMARVIMSGGGDCCLRLWDAGAHPPHLYDETKTGGEKRRKRKEKREKKTEEEAPVDTDDQAATVADGKVRSSKKFLLPMIHRQMNPCGIQGPRKMLQMYLEKAGDVVRTENASGEEFGLDYIKMFGNINEVNELLDTEMERHQDTGNTEAWSLVCVMRGCVDTAIQVAAARDQLDPLLLSQAPGISFKYWKDATQLYLQQIERLVAKGEEARLAENKPYGGPIFRKMAVQLSLHDIKGAVTTLLDARLFQEAYLLSRTRYMDSLAEQTLRLWAHECVLNGNYNTSALCYIALGDLSQAAAALGKSSDEDSLSLAADIAKVLGQTTFAGHIEERRELIKSKKELLVKLDDKVEDQELKDLPSRSDLAVKEHDAGTSQSGELEEKAKEVSSSHEKESTANAEAVESVKVECENKIEKLELQEKETAKEVSSTDEKELTANAEAAESEKGEGENKIGNLELQEKETAKEVSSTEKEFTANAEAVESEKEEGENKIENLELQEKETAKEVSSTDVKELTANAEAVESEKGEGENKIGKLELQEKEMAKEVSSTDEKELTENAEAVESEKGEDEKIEKLLEDLPEIMEGLLKDGIQNGTHKGDGDTIQNGEATDQQNNNEILAKPLENGSECVQEKSATE